MADVYVAFVRDDQSYAEALAVALQGSGFTVSRSASVVEAIDECGAIIVLWTPAAARSKLFVDAADRAHRSGKMVMARMGADPLPQMFAGVEAHSLARWSGDPESPEIDDIVFHVDRLVSRTRMRPGGEAQPETGHAQQRERGVVHRFPSGGGGARAAARPMEAPAPRQPAPQPYQAPADPLAEEAAYWRRIQHSTDPNEFYAYMERYGRNGTFAELAEQRMRSLAPRPTPRPTAPMPAPMPTPMPQSMLPQNHGHGHMQPPVQRGGFTMNPPMARPMPAQAAPRLDPHPARSRIEPDPTAPRDGGGGMRGLMLLIFLAVIGGGGFYVYQQLQGPAPAVGNAEEPWTPPAGSPAEPDAPLSTATGNVASLAATPASQRGAPAADRRQQPRQVEPEPPPPPPVFRTLPPAPATVAVTDPANDLQRDVGPTAAAPVQVLPAAQGPTPAVAVARTRPRWAQRPTVRDMQGAYPASAQRRNVEGRVVLDCLIGTDLAVRCRSISETPAGYGFAAAALRVAQQYRAAATLEDGRPAAGERAQLSMQFKPE